MKYLYRGHIYEATYFGTTSPFNLDLLADLHDTSEMILEFLQDWVSMYISELRKPRGVNRHAKMGVEYPVKDAPRISVMVVNEKEMGEAGATYEPTNDGGHLIRVNFYELTKSQTVGEAMFSNIMHEVTHVFQSWHGNIDSDVYGQDGKIDMSKYFTTTSEINAFILSIVGMITYSTENLKKYSSMSLEQFSVESLKLIFPEFSAMLNSAADEDAGVMAMKKKIESTLRIIHSKLAAGYFSKMARRTLTTPIV